MTATQNDIQRLIECCICCDYLTDVRETSCCHQLFCRACIQAWLEASTKTCPRCRSTNLTDKNLLENIVIQRFVDNLKFDCPHKLQGCPAEVPRSDLNIHKESCSFSPERLENKQRTKLRELHALLEQYQENASKVTDNDYYNLAKSFYIEHEYNQARRCLQLIKNRNTCPEVITLQAQIEHDDSHYDLALELYIEAYNFAKSVIERVDLLLARGNIYIKIGQYGEAKDSLRQALDLLQNGENVQKRAEVLNAFGLIAKKCSDYDTAISTYNSALEIVDEDSDLHSEILSNLADIHRKKANYNEAKNLYLKSLKKMEALYGLNHPAIADIMNNLGMLLKKQGKYNEALDYLKQALRISKHFYGDEHPTIGMYLTNVGDIQRKQGDFKTAEATYSEALTALEKTFGPNHIEVAEVLNAIGLILKKRADYDGAEQYYTRAIQIIKDTFGHEKEHYKLGIYYNNLADLDRKRNRFDSALQLYECALKAIEKTLGPQHSEAAEILHNIGLVHHQLGNYQQAVAYIERALVIIQKEFDDKHYKYGMFLNSLGLAYAMLDDYKTAYTHMKKALEILLIALGNDHIEVCDVYANLGDVCMKLVAESDYDKTQTSQTTGKQTKNSKIAGKQTKIQGITEKQTKLDEAKKYYTQAHRIVQLTFGPEHTKARQFLSLLFIVDNYNSF